MGLADCWCRNIGSDGTGNSVAPQLPGLIDAGFDIRYNASPFSMPLTALSVLAAIEVDNTPQDENCLAGAFTFHPLTDRTGLR